MKKPYFFGVVPIENASKINYNVPCYNSVLYAGEWSRLSPKRKENVK
jgi:hypothetical protein